MPIPAAHAQKIEITQIPQYHPSPYSLSTPASLYSYLRAGTIKPIRWKPSKKHPITRDHLFPSLSTTGFEKKLKTAYVKLSVHTAKYPREAKSLSCITLLVSPCDVINAISRSVKPHPMYRTRSKFQGHLHIRLFYLNI